MRKQIELIAPCHFGLEAVCKREILDLGYEISRVEDGKVTFAGDWQAIADANIFLRTPERILLKAGEIHAESFDELFEKTKALPWEEVIPKEGRFWVAKANSVKSKLFSPSDIQSIMKKAIVERLKTAYGIDWFPETGPDYPIRVAFNKDLAQVGIDTTGISLHKRGYRKVPVKAPITETLASALLMLTPWKPDRILLDPFCGSGTFPVEAAMIAADMAPGMNREFLAAKWDNLSMKEAFDSAYEEARERVRMDVKTEIYGSDIDPKAIMAAKANARTAGVEKLVSFCQQSVADVQREESYGFLIANPPYGERLEDEKTLPEIYRMLGRAFEGLDKWSMYLITSYTKAEQYLGRRADKNRKIYNGMLKTYFYQFPGPKPGRRKDGGDV